MKYGVRKPSVKKSISARTTGKIKRQVKSSVDPLYGKKGMGVINDPKKAAYNAVYDRTTVQCIQCNRCFFPDFVGIITACFLGCNCHRTDLFYR